MSKAYNDEEKATTQRDVQAIFGYDKSTCKYAMRYIGEISLSWVYADQLIGTDPRWFEIAQQNGMPVKDKNRKWRALPGALTRAQAQAQTRKVATDTIEFTRAGVGATGIIVPCQCAGELRCIATTLFNMASTILSKQQQEEIIVLETSESALVNKLRKDNWPIRMKAPKEVTTVGPGDWLVSTQAAHIDGLRVFEDGSCHFYSCDQRISKYVLTEEHQYVKELLSRPVLRVIQLVKPDAVKLNKQMKRKRDRERKKLAKKAKLVH